MVEFPSRDDFAGQSNTSFRLFFDEATIADVALIEVSELSRRPRQESFSLLFLAPPNAPALQQIFRVEHPVLGAFELFMVAVGRNEKGVEYEAIFNQLTD